MKQACVESRIQLKNILFATDFSPAACAAAPYAAELARHYGAQLFALHVRPPAVNPMAPPATWGGLEEAARIVAEEEKRKLLDTFSGLDTQVLIGEGDLWLHLFDAIEKYRIDLIVAGTRGRSGVSKFLLGSGAEEILRQAPCPVLTVGPYSAAEPGRAGKFEHILFATDFSPASVAAAPYAISLAQEYQARLTLLHVLANPGKGDLAQPWEAAPSFRQLLRNVVPPDANSWCALAYVVEQGAAAEKILEVATQNNADLIVLGVRQPKVFPGAATHLPMATAHKVVSHAACPVLTVRA